MTEIPKQLRNARRASGTSQKALGDRMGFPQSHVSAIESGKVDPRLSNVIEMARLLDHEPMLIPRNLVPVIRAMLDGKAEEPLWQTDESEETET